MLISVLKDIFHRPTDADRDVAAVPGPSPSETWLHGLVARVFQLMHNVERDNFDGDRYRNEPSNAFFAERHASYFNFLLTHAHNFFAARELLEDQISRELFDELLLFRTLGHLHVRLPFNTAANRAQIGIAERWRMEETNDAGPFGPLSIFLVPYPEGDIRVKGWKENVVWTFLYRQYYFDREGIKIEPEVGDRVIDAGGCFGDTALGFAAAVGQPGHVYVFDPLPRHCAIMREQLALNPRLAPRISIFPLGLADRTNDIPALEDDGVINPGARIAGGGIPLTTIDDVVDRYNAAPVNFIKMDIEGSELAALKGAESTLRRWHPKLAISLYHRPEDFFEIPRWVDSLGIGYRLFLDHYSIHHEETVLYATV